MTSGQILGGLGIIAVYGALFYLWYAVKKRKGVGAWLHKQSSEREIRFIEAMSLGVRSTLTLVEVRGQRFLILTTPQGASMQPVSSTAKISDSPLATSDFERSLKEAVR